MSMKRYPGTRRAVGALIVIFLLLLFCALLAACSADAPEEQEAEPVPIGWDYFDAFDPIGQTYESISSEYGSLEEEGVYDGGVVLRVDGSDLYFGFPCYSKDEIQGSDTCTSVYGTLGTVFGLSESYASDDLEKLLSVTWEKEYGDMYVAYASHAGKSYAVRLDADTINELYGPKTGVAVFTYDGSGGEEEPITEDDTYVYVKLHPIDSDFISGIGYDAEHSILAIEFRESQELIYYYDVPEDVYTGLESSDSQRSYFEENIRNAYLSVERN